jgi:hypothetical protein
MDVEYSNHKQSGGYAFIIDQEEKKIIAAAFKKEIPKLQKKITAIEQDENNEGQATYLCAIDELFDQIKRYEQNIELLK